MVDQIRNILSYAMSIFSFVETLVVVFFEALVNHLFVVSCSLDVRARLFYASKIRRGYNSACNRDLSCLSFIT